MAKLSTPSGINSTGNDANKTITVTWNKVKDETLTGANFKLVNKDGTKVFEVPAAAVTVGTSTEKNEYILALGEKYSTVKSYYAQVQAKTAIEADNSDWGKQAFWVAGASITIEIGGTPYTLSTDSGKGEGDGIYKIPKPIVVTYTDLQEFVTTIDMGFELPDSIMGIDLQSTELTISELLVDTKKKLFIFSVSIKASLEIVTGLSINNVGFIIKRTDGSI